MLYIAPTVPIKLPQRHPMLSEYHKGEGASRIGIANKLNDYRRLQFVAREVLIRKEPSVSTGASSEDVYGHMIFNLLFPNFRVMVLMFG